MGFSVTFLGTGTSQGVPMIACNCRVCSSSDPHDKRLRSSVLIKSDEGSIVIDTGPDFRQQMLREGIEKLDAVVFTHEHKDHIAGLDDIRAYNYFSGVAMDVYATERVQMALKREFAYVFDENTYPGIPKINLFTIGSEPFRCSGFRLQPVFAMHLKMPVVGFRCGQFAYITDANFISQEEKLKLYGLDVLVINALRKEPHVSHFTLNEAIELGREVGAREVYFTHLSHQMGLHREVNRELPAGFYLAYDGLTITLG